MIEELSKTQIAEKYVEKYLEINKRTGKQFSKAFIGNVMYQENSDMFKHAEDGRYYVRYVLGLTGHTTRGKKDTNLLEQFAFINEQITDTPNNEPFVIPKAYDNILCISDIHSIFYDKEALLTALEFGKKRNCNGVLINGDFLDCYSFSKFSKNPRITAEFIINEREWGTEMLQLLQNEFGYVVYKAGNHCVRRELQLQSISASHPEILEAFTLKEYLNFDMSNIQFVEDYRIVKMGKLNAAHGHELYMSGGVNAARNVLLKTFDNIISGHSHVVQSYPMKDLDGNIYMSYKTGCLCQLKPRYSPINSWQHGMAIIEIESNGDFHVENKMIHNGKVY